MKGKVLVTISDINGSKQYTIPELIKHFALWIFITLIIIFAIDLMIFKMFSDNTSDLASNSQKKMEVVSRN
jgi:dolichyl-phosphate-mannose--protein O-mannosyl transferase